MPVVFMDKLDEGTSSFSGSESRSPLNWDTVQSDGRMHQRRQRNRDAARKSRKRQTERADVLHEEMQALERSNAAIVKEIAELKKEVQRYTTALQQHEAHCTLLSLPGPSVPVTVSLPNMPTSNPEQNYNSISNDELLFMTTQDTVEIQDLSLSELLDRTEWLPWDPVDI